MRLTITHELNAHFVEIMSAQTASFHHEGVAITVVASQAEDGPRFGSVGCSATVAFDQRDVDEGTEGIAVTAVNDLRMAPDFPFFIPPSVDPRWDSALSATYARIEGALEPVGSLIRWRFHLSGKDAVFKCTTALVETETGEVIDLHPVAQVGFGDDSAAIPDGGLGELETLLAADVREPLGHQLWREAWNLHYSNRRSSLVIGVTAAEVGMKQLIATLVPTARWLVEELPSPPLVKMMKHYVPDLPVRVEVDRDRRCPKHLLTKLQAAVEERNDVVHRGATPGIYLRETLLAVRELLYLLDFYAGNLWAVSYFSPEMIAALGIENATA